MEKPLPVIVSQDGIRFVREEIQLFTIPVNPVV